MKTSNAKPSTRTNEGKCQLLDGVLHGILHFNSGESEASRTTAAATQLPGRVVKD